MTEVMHVKASSLRLLNETGDEPVSTDRMSDAVASFSFPDELWAEIVYDLVVAARPGWREDPRFLDTLTS